MYKITQVVLRQQRMADSRLFFLRSSTNCDSHAANTCFDQISLEMGAYIFRMRQI